MGCENWQRNQVIKIGKLGISSLNKFQKSCIIAGGLLTVRFIGSTTLAYQYQSTEESNLKDTNKDQSVSQFIIQQSQYQQKFFSEQIPQNQSQKLQQINKKQSIKINDGVNSDLFSKFVDQCFEVCDYDGNGTIDERELYIALLLLYDKINRQLPCSIPVPQRIQIKQYMQLNDKNGDGCLDKQEFQEMAQKMLFQSEKPFDSVFFNIGLGIFVHVVGLPFAAHYLKQFIIQMGVQNAKKIPVAVLAGIIGVILPCIQTGIMYQNYGKNSYQISVNNT